MTAKEYLSQARLLNQEINLKIAQLQDLNALATKATSALTGMPRNPSPAASSLENAVTKIMDLQTEIDSEVDELVELRREIGAVIRALPSREHRVILARRYLFSVPQSWEQIAASMNYTVRHLTRLHGEALEEVRIILQNKENMT